MTAGAAHAAGLGLAAAAIWGAADFAGGLAARRAGPSLVVLLAHGSSIFLLLLAVFLWHIPLPSEHLASIALLSGAANGFALLCFYEALALDTMGLPAAVAGVLTAVLPVLVSMVQEGRPTLGQMSGFALAVVAIWLIAVTPGGKPHPRGLGLAVLAGIGFGIQLTLLHIAGRGGVVWAMTWSRIAGALVAGAALPFAKRAVRGSNKGLAAVVALAVVAGIFDTGGNVCYTFASLMGRLDIAAVLASLYPAGTILLAALLLRERTTRRQTVGMGLALAAVALIAA